MPSIAESASPLYAQIAQSLSEDILRGTYPTGSLLPTEAELCRRFDVSRITLRSALHQLEMRGMISRRAGIGTRVEASAPRERFVHEGASIDGIVQFTDDMIFQFIEAWDEVLTDPGRASWLCCPLGETVTLVKGLRRSTRSGEPVCLSTHVVRGQDADRARRLFEGAKGSLATLLERETGRRVDLIRQTVEAANLSNDEAVLLQTPAGEAALATWRWYFAGSDQLLLASNSLFPRGRYTLTSTVRREEERNAPVARRSGGAR